MFRAEPAFLCAGQFFVAIQHSFTFVFLNKKIRKKKENKSKCETKLCMKLIERMLEKKTHKEVWFSAFLFF